MVVVWGGGGLCSDISWPLTALWLTDGLDQSASAYRHTSLDSLSVNKAHGLFLLLVFYVFPVQLETQVFHQLFSLSRAVLTSWGWLVGWLKPNTWYVRGKEVRWLHRLHCTEKREKQILSGRRRESWCGDGGRIIDSSRWLWRRESLTSDDVALKKKISDKN